MFKDVLNLLNEYSTVSLDEMESVKLMNRVDTKYVVTLEQAYQMLLVIKPLYKVLEIEKNRIGSYHSVYYDTVDLQMFHTHVTGRFPRFKVRERTYSQNQLTFFEIKHKNNKGRTSKERLSIDTKDVEINNMSGLIAKMTPFDLDHLKPVITNLFDRVTLVNQKKTERITLDFNLQFQSNQDIETPVYSGVVIIEMKQSKREESTVREYLKQQSIKKSGMSKYCLGTLLLNSDVCVKRYKPNLTKFLKLQNGHTTV